VQSGTMQFKYAPDLFRDGVHGIGSPCYRGRQVRSAGIGRKDRVRRHVRCTYPARRNETGAAQSGLTPRGLYMRIVVLILTTATLVAAQSDDATAGDSPFTNRDRFRWVVLSTIGPKNLAAGVFVAGINTWRGEPEGYSTHWDGFGQRYGARLAAGGTSHVIEAGFGSLWGEDPRYFRAAGQPLRTRLGHVVK